jgi:hypothetical protein
VPRVGRTLKVNASTQYSGNQLPILSKRASMDETNHDTK